MGIDSSIKANMQSLAPLLSKNQKPWFSCASLYLARTDTGFSKSLVMYSTVSSGGPIQIVAPPAQSTTEVRSPRDQTCGVSNLQNEEILAARHSSRLNLIGSQIPAIIADRGSTVD